MLAKWYQEGLIDPEFSTRDSYSEVINANESGIFFGPWWMIGYGTDDAFNNNPDVNWQAYPLYNAKGEWNPKTNAIGSSYLVVNKKASEDVAKAVTIINNVLVRDEASFDTSVGIRYAVLWLQLTSANTAIKSC